MDMAMKQIQPRAVICDTQLSERMTLERHLGLATTGATKHITKGIQAVSERLKIGPDREPSLFFLSDMLDRRDVTLDEKKQPCSFLDEVDAYCWDPLRDKPVDKYNHSMDVVRYVCMQLDCGMSGLWEAAEAIYPDGQRGTDGRGILHDNPAVNPQPRLRYGEDGRAAKSRQRRGGRLFGRGYHG